MSDQVVRVRIDLRHTQPKVRRRIDIPIWVSLNSLHYTIQAAMGWNIAHLHEFRVGQNYYIDPELFFEEYGDDHFSTHETDLSDLIGQGVKRFIYLYDFGDDWEHDIYLWSVREVEDGDEYPALVNASGRCPPEDCGGVYGYTRLIEAHQDPSHEMHQELLEWCDPFDPQDVDEQTIRDRLARLDLVPKDPDY